MSGKVKKNIKVYVAVGSNLGDRLGHIDSAIETISANPDVNVGRKSRVVESSPLAGLDQPSYLNCVVEVHTCLSANELLDFLQSVEDLLGRVRDGKYGSRTIDLDIALYDDEIIETAKLTVPHGQMHLRSFVVDRLCEIDASIVHPVLGCSVKELSNRLNGYDFVIDESQPRLISFAGVIGVGKTTLARSLGEIYGVKLIEEQYDENPYLSDVYAGREDLALDSELFFVNSSAKQLSAGVLVDDEIYINDYIFDKAVVYAKRWLADDLIDKYMLEYDKLREKVLQPSLVIYLKDDIELCLERIHLRNRPYEQHIEAEFLANLESDYDELFKSWNQCPVLTVNNFDAMDFEAVKKFSEQVSKYIYL